MGTETLLLALAILGGVDLAGRGVDRAALVFPKLRSAQSSAWQAVSGRISTRLFGKKAVAIRVEEVLNQTVNRLQKYLPKGWTRRARISWVYKPTKSSLHDGDIVLRVRPSDSADHSLMNAIWIYFQEILFPENRDSLPKELLASSALAITRAGLGETHPHLLKEFDSRFLALAKEAQQSKVDLYADCTRLNEFGLLMGPFVREADHAAEELRFRGQNEIIRETVRSIMDHMLGFQPLLRHNKPEDQWSFHGPNTSYGFLLISRPPTTRPSPSAYVKRVEAMLGEGVERIYLIGRAEERNFVKDVAAQILSLRGVKGIEQFSMYRDYRGEDEGIGILIGRDNILSGLNLSRRAVPLLASTQFEESHEGDGVLSAPDKCEIQSNGLASTIEEIMVRLSDYDGGWVTLAEFGNELRRLVPDFTPQHYGERSLFPVLKKYDQLEFEEKGGIGAKVVYVRMRPGHSSVLAERTRKLEEIGITVTQTLLRYSRDWVFLGTIGFLMKKYHNEVDLSSFGFESLHDFITHVPSLEIDERGPGRSKTYVRVKPSLLQG